MKVESDILLMRASLKWSVNKYNVQAYVQGHSASLLHKRMDGPQSQC